MKITPEEYINRIEDSSDHGKTLDNRQTAARAGADASNFLNSCPMHPSEFLETYPGDPSKGIPPGFLPQFCAVLPEPYADPKMAFNKEADPAPTPTNTNGLDYG